MGQLLKVLTEAVQPCDQAEKCLNSPEHRAEDAECMWCKWADAGGATSDKWRPWNKTAVHPKKLAEKKQARRETLAKRVEKRQTKSTSKIRQSRSAVRAERMTERSMIKSTVNSGRTFQDGDHDFGNGRIALDTKEQTNRVDPIIKLAELDKIRLQAKASNHVIGALVIRNKEGRGLVVMDEADYGLYFSKLLASMARELLDS